MSDVTLDVLNKRANIAAVHAEAERAGLNAEALLDSKDFYVRVASLDPDAPGYRGQVRDLVASAAGQRQAPVAQPPPAAQPAAPAGPPQWSLEDVERSSPSEVAAAWESGQLRDLGYSPRRKRR